MSETKRPACALTPSSGSPTASVCEWKEDFDGTWTPGCFPDPFVFIAGGPNHNRFKFCPHCGNALREAHFRGEE